MSIQREDLLRSILDANEVCFLFSLTIATCSCSHDDSNRSTPPLSLKPTPPSSRSSPKANRLGSAGWVAPIPGYQPSCKLFLFSPAASLHLGQLLSTLKRQS